MTRAIHRRGRTVAAAVLAVAMAAGCGDAQREPGGAPENTEPPEAHGPLELTQGGDTRIPVLDEPGETATRTLTLGVAKDQPLPHGPDSDIAHSYRITIQARELKGLADVKLPCDVREGGYESVCSGPDVSTLIEEGTSWKITVTADHRMKVGRHPKIEVYTQVENFANWPDRPPAWWYFIVGPTLKPAARHTGGKDPGDVHRSRLGFHNRGPNPADGVVLWYQGTAGLRFPEKYRNCFYRSKRRDGNVDRRIAYCTFEGTFAPDQRYVLDTPIPVKIAADARHETFYYTFHLAGHVDIPRDFDGFRQGDGPRLRLTEAPADAFPRKGPVGTGTVFLAGE